MHPEAQLDAEVADALPKSMALVFGQKCRLFIKRRCHHGSRSDRRCPTWVPSTSSSAGSSAPWYTTASCTRSDPVPENSRSSLRNKLKVPRTVFCPCQSGQSSARTGSSGCFRCPTELSNGSRPSRSSLLINVMMGVSRAGGRPRACASGFRRPGAVDDPWGWIDRGEHAIGVFGKVPGGPACRGGWPDVPGSWTSSPRSWPRCRALFHRQESRGRAGRLYGADGAGHSNRATEQQQLFCERRFAGVGVADDGEGAAAIDFCGRSRVGEQAFWFHGSASLPKTFAAVRKRPRARPTCYSLLHVSQDTRPSSSRTSNVLSVLSIAAWKSDLPSVSLHRQLAGLWGLRDVERECGVAACGLVIGYGFAWVGHFFLKRTARRRQFPTASWATGWCGKTSPPANSILIRPVVARVSGGRWAAGARSTGARLSWWASAAAIGRRSEGCWSFGRTHGACRFQGSLISAAAMPGAGAASQEATPASRSISASRSAARPRHRPALVLCLRVRRVARPAFIREIVDTAASSASSSFRRLLDASMVRTEVVKHRRLVVKRDIRCGARLGGCRNQGPSPGCLRLWIGTGFWSASGLLFTTQQQS